MKARATQILLIVIAAAAAVCSAACDAAYPEVVIVNDIGPGISVKSVGYNGCKWDEILEYGEASKPHKCLPGEGAITFEKLGPLTCYEGADRYKFKCFEEWEVSGASVSEDVADDLLDARTMWFNYVTTSQKSVDYGEFHVFTITARDMEQDFSVPGPYGH